MPANEQGVNQSRYSLIPRTLIFLTKGEQVLLLKGAKSKRLWSGLFNGIGGHVEPSEDILTAAYRELREETGLTSPLLFLCGILTVDTNTNPGVCVFIFKGECFEDKLIFSSEGTLTWINYSEIGKIPLVADLPALLPKILPYKHESEIFFAKSWYDENGKVQVKFGFD